VESNTFGSEFVSLKIAMEMNCAMHYKLRMMGVPIAGPTNMFGDNKSVVCNVVDPVSTLNSSIMPLLTTSVVRRLLLKLPA